MVDLLFYVHYEFFMDKFWVGLVVLFIIKKIMEKTCLGHFMD